jgi:hypothetical protein
MQNVVNMSSSFIALLLQFHMKTLYLVTLSNFMYKIKLCYGATWMVTQNCDVAPLWSLHG